jgi:hypothetical protein
MPEVRWPNFASFPEDGFSQQENLATPMKDFLIPLLGTAIKMFASIWCSILSDAH